MRTFSRDRHFLENLVCLSLSQCVCVYVCVYALGTEAKYYTKWNLLLLCCFEIWCFIGVFLNLGDLLVQKLGEGVKGVYISIDVDCLDPAFAPGVSHIEPGGLSFRDVLNILHNLQGDVVAGDVVEFNPQRDTVDGMTAMVAAKLVRELAAKIAK